MIAATDLEGFPEIPSPRRTGSASSRNPLADSPAGPPAAPSAAMINNAESLTELYAISVMELESIWADKVTHAVPAIDCGVGTYM